MEANTKILSGVQEKPYFIKDEFVLYNADSLGILAPSCRKIQLIWSSPIPLTSFQMAVLLFMLADALVLIKASGTKATD